MKIIDRIKNIKMSPLMCASLCETKQCYAYEDTLDYGPLTFFLVMPILVFFLIRVITKKKVSFKKFSGFLLLSLPLYLLLFYGLCLVCADFTFTSALAELFRYSRRMMLLILSSILIVSFILFLFKKVSWPYVVIPFLMLFGIVYSGLVISYC